nr:hypothetical protein [Cystobacter sp.]
METPNEPAIIVKSTGTTTAATRTTAPKLIVVDMGRHKRKRIKQLRQGQGKLLDKVTGVLQTLEAQGTLESGTNTVVIVVERREEEEEVAAPGGWRY